MLIMALDLATVTGFALGEPGATPRSGIVRLKKGDDDLEVAARNLGCWLRDRWTFEKPDLVVFEAPLPFFAEHADGHRRSFNSLLLPPMLMGALLGIAGPYGIRCDHYQANTIRKRFLGKASFGGREETKQAVLRQAKAERLIPSDCTDDNRADAVATWMVGCMQHGLRAPRELVMFGERVRA